MCDVAPRVAGARSEAISLVTREETEDARRVPGDSPPLVTR
jgi:hypothetical protein